MIQQLKRFFQDKDGHWAIIDWPNVPLIVWFGCVAMARLTNGRANHGVSALGSAALLTWAYLEITAGKSWFRRVVGSIVAIYVIMSFFI